MDWYKKSQQEQELSDIIFIEDIEDMAKRVWGQNGEALKEYGFDSWKDWLEKEKTKYIADTVNSYYEIYDLYLSKLPGNIDDYDVIEAYKEGKLRYRGGMFQYQHQTRDLSDEDDFESKYPWHHKQDKQENSELQKLFKIAKQRFTKNSSEDIKNARRTIFFEAYNGNLTEILGITKGELNRIIKSWSGLNARTIQTQRSLNQGVGEEHQWTGIQNTSFLGSKDILSEEIDKFVKKIEVPEDQKNNYQKYQGEYLRRNILITFMAIDTGISYEDLNFVIKKIEGTAMGKYNRIENTIYIDDNNQHTVAHEIGHYLDYKLAKEFNPKTSNALSDFSTSTKNIPFEQQEWINKYKQFIKHLMVRADSGSEYLQRPGEVMARFISKFVDWTTGNKQRNFYHDRNDNFSEIEFKMWVKLLQEKSYINKYFPIIENKK